MTYPDDFALREMVERAKRVHCLLGFPLDMMTMDDVLAEISEATRTRHRLFISTVNLNFVTMAQTDNDFRNSLRSSNLCVADGVAVKLIGRLLGIPIPERVAGSDILNAFRDKSSNPQDPPLKVFFFGGNEEAGQLASDAVNRHPSGRIACVGNIYPGYGSVEDMSSQAILAEINRARPDFLIVALGAKKGQEWIMRNMNKLEVPVISHLGATINFLSGTLKRAPLFWQRAGLEWLWRVKEEPSLAKRYWSDGLALLRLLLTKIGALSIWFHWCRWRWRADGFSMHANVSQVGQTKLVLKGSFKGSHVAEVLRVVASATTNKKPLLIDVSAVNWIDTKGMGSLLLLSQHMQINDYSLKISHAPAILRWAMRSNGLGNCLTN